MDTDTLGIAALRHYGSLNKLSKAIGITRAAISYRLDRGLPMVTAEEAVALEAATDGALARAAMRPDLWP